MKFDVRDLASIGGAMGLVLFFLFGLSPSLAFGADAAQSMASPFISNELTIGFLMLVGAIIGLFTIAGTFTATFAAAGAMLGAVKKSFKRN